MGCKVGKLTNEQKRIIKKNLGKVYRKDLAKMARISVSTLQRYCYFENLSTKKTIYSPQLINQVVRYYEKHGKVPTQEKFPNVRLRSIIERHPHKFRQEKWKDDEIKEVTKMSHLVPMRLQAKYLNRPNANGGSIRSVWQKTIGANGAYVNGLPLWLAKPLITKSCPVYYLKFICYDIKTNRHDEICKPLVLWIDIKRHLRATVPDHIKDAISAMVKFQKWIHGRNVRLSIKKIIEERAGHEVITKKAG